MRKYTPVDLPQLNRVDGGANGRRYVTPDGNAYLSVTTVFSVQPEPEILEWRLRVGAEEAERIGKRAAARGTYIHEQAERLLKSLPASNDRLKLMAYGDMWNTFKPVVEQIGDVFAMEAPLYSDYLKTAGTVDCVGMWNGKLSIIDFKTSKRVKSADDIQNYWMQCAAYAVMWEERTKQPITQLVILMAVDDNAPLVYTSNRDKWIKQFILLRKEYANAIGE